MPDSGETRYFIIKKIGEQQYLFKTVDGQIFAEGRSFFCKNWDSPVIVITHYDGSQSLFDENGVAYRNAFHVDFVSFRNNGKSYIVRKTKTGNFKRYGDRYNHIRMRKALSITISLLTIIGGLGGLFLKNCEKHRKLNELEATYLKTENGMALFDTDNNDKTAEIRICTYLNQNGTKKQNLSMIKGLENQEGQKHKVMEWCQLTGLDWRVFDEKIRE